MDSTIHTIGVDIIPRAIIGIVHIDMDGIARGIVLGTTLGIAVGMDGTIHGIIHTAGIVDGTIHGVMAIRWEDTITTIILWVVHA